MSRPKGTTAEVNRINVADVVDVNWPGWKGRGIVMEKRWDDRRMAYLFVVKMVECENPRLLYTNGGFFVSSLTLVTDP